MKTNYYSTHSNRLTAIDCNTNSLAKISVCSEEGLLQGGGKSFLAAMSSSRSDGVTQFVHSSVRPYPFFLLVSLEFLVHFECQQARCFKSVTSVSLGRPKAVSRVF